MSALAALSHAPAAEAKRAKTRAQDRRFRKDDVRKLRLRGMVPLAIGPALGLTDSLVARYLRELEHERAIEPIPAYLSLAPAETA